MHSIETAKSVESAAIEREGELLGVGGTFDEKRGVELTGVQKGILDAFGSKDMDRVYGKLFQEFAELAGEKDADAFTGETIRIFMEPKKLGDKTAQRSFLLRLTGISRVDDWRALGLRYSLGYTPRGQRLVDAIDARRRTYPLRRVFEHSNSDQYHREKKLMARITEKTGLTWKTLFTEGNEPLFENSERQSRSRSHESFSLAQYLALYAAAMDVATLEEAATTVHMKKDTAQRLLSGMRNGYSDAAVDLITKKLGIAKERRTQNG